MRIGSLRMVLAKVVVALVFLLGAGAAQAFVVRDPGSLERAIGITNLDIGGTPYDVIFLTPTEAINVYGPELPGVFDFDTSASAEAAVDAVIAELNLAGGVNYVGPEGGPNSLFAELFAVAWSSSGTGTDPFALANTWEGTVSSATWSKGSDQALWIGDARTYADFTVVPEPGTALLLGLGLAGLGVARRLKRQERKATA